MANTAKSKQIAFENYELSSPVQGSTDRAFGLVFTCFFGIVAGIKYWPEFLDGSFLHGLGAGFESNDPGLSYPLGYSLSHLFSYLLSYPWILGAILTFVLAMVCPIVLKPFNYIWMRFGLLLHRIMNPIIMSLLFYCILTPTGLLARCFKWDPLRLHLAPEVSSYWIIRDESQATNLKNQF